MYERCILGRLCHEKPEHSTNPAADSHNSNSHSNNSRSSNDHVLLDSEFECDPGVNGDTVQARIESLGQQIVEASRHNRQALHKLFDELIRVRRQQVIIQHKTGHQKPPPQEFAPWILLTVKLEWGSLADIITAGFHLEHNIRPPEEARYRMSTVARELGFERFELLYLLFGKAAESRRFLDDIPRYHNNAGDGNNGGVGKELERESTTTRTNLELLNHHDCFFWSRFYPCLLDGYKREHNLPESTYIIPLLARDEGRVRSEIQDEQEGRSGEYWKGKEKTDAKTLALAAGGSESDSKHIPIFKPRLLRSADAEAQRLYACQSSTSYSPHPSLSPEHRGTAARQSPNAGTRQSGQIRTRHGSYAGMTSSGPSKRRDKSLAVQVRKAQQVQGGAYGRGEDEPEPEVDHSQPRSSNDHSYGHEFDQSTDNGGGEGSFPEGDLFNAQTETGRRQDEPSLHSRLDFDHTLDGVPADNGLTLLASADAESAKHSHAYSDGHRHEEANENPKPLPSTSLYYNRLGSLQFKHSPEMEPAYKSELETDTDHAPTPAVRPSVSQSLRSRMEQPSVDSSMPSTQRAGESAKSKAKGSTPQARGKKRTHGVDGAEQLPAKRKKTNGDSKDTNMDKHGKVLVAIDSGSDGSGGDDGDGDPWEQLINENESDILLSSSKWYNDAIIQSLAEILTSLCPRYRHVSCLALRNVLGKLPADSDAGQKKRNNGKDEKEVTISGGNGHEDPRTRMRRHGFLAGLLHNVDHVLVTVNCNNQHWILCHISLDHHSVFVYDSLVDEKGKFRAHAVATTQHLARHIDAFLEKDEMYLDVDVDLDTAATNWPCHDVHVPQQTNTDDCGVHVMINMLYLITNTELPPKEDSIDSSLYRTIFRALLLQQQQPPPSLADKSATSQNTCQDPALNCFPDLSAYFAAQLAS